MKKNTKKNLLIVFICALCSIFTIASFFCILVCEKNELVLAQEPAGYENLTILSEDWTENFLPDSITIKNVDATNKIAFIKSIRNFTKWGLAVSKNFYDNLPGVVEFENKTDEEIMSFIEELDSYGTVYSVEGKSSIKKIMFHSEALPDETEAMIVGSNNLSGILDNQNKIFHIYSQNGEMIYAPTNSSGLFASFTNLEEIDFSNFNTSFVVDMSAMFSGCVKLKNLDLTGFDTTNVTNMSKMFYKLTDLISLEQNFNTSNVIDMSYMFANMISIEQYDITNFDTSNVCDMSHMFTCNQNISIFNLESFNTSSVENFESVFNNCTKLKKLYIKNWQLDNDDNLKDFLIGCQLLNTIQINASSLVENEIELPRDYYCGIKTVTKICSVYAQFSDTYVVIDALPTNWLQIISNKLGKNLKFTTEINFIESAKEISEENEINSDIGFEYDDERKILDIFSSKIIISPEDLTSFVPANFNKLEKLNFDYFMLNSEVTSLSNLTDKNTNWSLKYSPLTVCFGDYFDTSNIDDMSCMFENCRHLKKVVFGDCFNTCNVTNMSKMFYCCNALTYVDVSNFDTSNVIDMSYMFASCYELLELDVSNFDTSSVTNMSCLFSCCNKLENLSVENFDTSNVTNMSCMFSCMEKITALDVSNFDTSNVEDMSCMFEYMISLTELDVSNFDTSNVIYMGWMFSGLEKLTSLDLSNFDTSNVTDMSGMFCGCCDMQEIDFSSFNTSKVECMESMFSCLSSITTLDVTNLDFGSCSSIYEFCGYCDNLEYVNITGIDTSMVEDFDYMFADCYNLKQIDGIEDLDVSSAIYLSGMFSNTFSIVSLDLSKWDVTSVEYISNMFDMYYIDDCEDFETTSLKYINLSGWQLNSIADYEWACNDVFNKCDSLETIVLPFYAGNYQLKLPCEYYLLNLKDLSDQSNITDVIVDSQPYAQILQKINTTYDMKLPKSNNFVNVKPSKIKYYIFVEGLLVLAISYYVGKLRRKKVYEKRI